MTKQVGLVTLIKTVRQLDIFSIFDLTSLVLTFLCPMAVCYVKVAEIEFESFGKVVTKVCNVTNFLDQKFEKANNSSKSI